ncbi:MAG: hypothetical protein ABSD20_18595, partial [Terriglobales bacterium]
GHKSSRVVPSLNRSPITGCLRRWLLVASNLTRAGVAGGVGRQPVPANVAIAHKCRPYNCQRAEHQNYIKDEYHN